MKAICVINTSGNYGGAEKRVVSLFDHISRERDDFMLIINKELHGQMTEKGILTHDRSINVINIPFDKNHFIKTTKKGQNAASENRKPSTLRNTAGRYKYFLKTVYQWIIFSKQLNAILKRNNVKNVYTIWQGGIWGRRVFKKLKIKTIYGANSNLIWHLEKGLLQRFDSQYRILRDASHVDFLSDGLVKELKGLMPEKDFPESYSVSPCSFIKYENFYPVHPKLNNVVFSGRLVQLKNPLLFLEAVKIFNSAFKDHKKISFNILGTGPLEKDMKSHALKNGLSNVVFKGKVSKPETILQHSKVFISIQQTENYPSQALIEAMACENAVIASDVGETRKLVTENEGELVRLDADEIANALIRLLSDDKTLSAKGKNARKKVISEHTIDRFKEYFYSLFD
jgi:glycosyltransferase involved in cell wall biosynthesis